MVHQHVELDSRTERCLLDIAAAEERGYDAAQVRARAAAIVDRHAVRLGLDEFAARQIIRLIEAIPAAIAA